MIYLTHIAAVIIGFVAGGWFVVFLAKMDDEKKPKNHD